jgi:hypothetical protein
MSALGHSRPMHSLPVPINVRCYLSAQPVDATQALNLTCSFNRVDFDYVWYRTFSMDSNPRRSLGSKCGRGIALPVSCPKNGDLPKSPLL